VKTKLAEAPALINMFEVLFIDYYSDKIIIFI